MIMPRRPAQITQADVARTIRAAKQAGASEVVSSCVRRLGARLCAVDSSAAPTQPSGSDEVTVERLESAIKVTARCMVEHDLPQLLTTLKRLEAERDRLVQDGDAIHYARRVLAG